MSSDSDPTKDLQRRFKTLFNSRLVGIITSDLQGNILDANDYFLEMLGYSRTDFQGRRFNWYDLTPKELHGISHEARERLKQTGDYVTLEKEYYHKDGHLVPVRLGSAFLTGQTVITLVVDMSAQKDSERKLQDILDTLEERVQARTSQLAESEAFLSAIIENMPSMVFVKGAKDLVFVRLNRAGEELLGISREEFVGKNDFDFFTPEVAEHFRSVDRQVVNGDIPFAITEDTLPTRNGIRFIHTIKMPIKNSAGECQFLLGVTEDITERKEVERQKEELMRIHAEKVAAESRARQENFVSELTFAMSRSFELREILYAFTAKVVPRIADLCMVEIIDEEGMDFLMTEIRGSNPDDEAFIRQWRLENPPKWDPEFGGPIMIKSGKTLVVNEVRHIERHVEDNFSADVDMGEEGDELLSEAFMVVPLFVRDGKPVGYVSFVSTRSRRIFPPAEQSLAEEICQRLAVLIENSRLYDRAQDASRAKSDFLANVSHEIRTPLGAMLGFAEILKDDATLSSEQRHSVDTVLRNGQQLLKIVNEVLDISKIESEKIEIEQLPFHLPDLLQDVVHLLQVQAEDKGIELRLSLSAIPDMVASDPGRIRQILINIVGNAIKFTERGFVEILVHAMDAVDSERIQLFFTIRDTGIGISKEQRGNLFQPFSQADSSTTRRFGGTGLGLFLSRKLARILGGDISFSSAVGKGSEFIVSIVVHKPSEKSMAADYKTNGGGPEGEARAAQTGAILVVDDASDNRELFKRYLIRAGLSENQIELAENGEEALQKAAGRSYRLILMDIQMPGMDGFQALHELRKNGYEGPIVALTAHAMKGDREKCLEAGFDEYLQKPLKKEALVEILNYKF